MYNRSLFQSAINFLGMGMFSNFLRIIFRLFYLKKIHKFILNEIFIIKIQIFETGTSETNSQLYLFARVGRNGQPWRCRIPNQGAICAYRLWRSGVKRTFRNGLTLITLSLRLLLSPRFFECVFHNFIRTDNLKNYYDWNFFGNTGYYLR